jgi:hypothetical protein
MKKAIYRFFVGVAKLFGEDEEKKTKPEIEQESILTPELEEQPIIVEAKQEVTLLPEPKGIEKESISELEIEEKQTISESKKKNKEQNVRRKKPRNWEIVTVTIDPRDIMETMGVPYLALSKNRKSPIVYNSPDGTTKVRISCHSEHYIASIYDWDIIQCIAGKIQETINSGQDIPSRNIIIPRHELLKELRKDDGKKARKEIEKSLARLKLTGIETTVRNEDYRYKGGFGFLDSWGYTERKDIKEFRISLSDWLYDGICAQGALLKVHEEYFDIKSGLKKVLYRIARKHVGNKNNSWDFSIEELHRKSGSERDLRKFKHDLQKAICDNDIPGYPTELFYKDGKTFIRFINGRKKIKEIISRWSVDEDQPK